MEPTAWRALVAVGFLLSQTILIYFFYETQKSSRELEAVRLARDLSADFYVKDEIHRNVRNAVEECAPLYKSWGGRFTHDEINRYLGFFEDLGYYQRKEFLETDIIAHFYGAYIIEAYEHPEFKRYIELLRKNAKQPNAFVEFERLAKNLEKDPQFSELVKAAPTLCKFSGTGAQP